MAASTRRTRPRPTDGPSADLRAGLAAWAMAVRAALDDVRASVWRVSSELRDNPTGETAQALARCADEVKDLAQALDHADQCVMGLVVGPGVQLPDPMRRAEGGA